MVVDELGSKGEPIKLLGVSARFGITCGAIVKDKLHDKITMTNWKKVPDTKKDVLFAKLKERFQFPEGQEKFARRFVEGLLGNVSRTRGLI
ncbi:hypothetical protein BAE44_0018808 [Dichanthelium oligosanthes]|uniref:Uncharacterized protein n=1 Tax=Dichanthelium oligosanthes TaxID=888268 RepID=A0A1E5V4T9_9POAL|nr:hypothetical protein BAE44_0018808 [Dichanthelium oligosanthes]